MPKVTIVGVGALGSHVALLLRTAAQLKFIDFDRVEAKNTQSQFHGRLSIGQNKAKGLAQSLEFLFGVKSEHITHRLTADNVETLLADADLVIDAVDNGATRRIIQEHARKARKPCLHGALAADGVFGRVVWSPHFTVDDEPATGQATCENGDHLPFIMLVSSIIAREAQGFLRFGRRADWHVTPSSVTMTHST